MSVKVSIIMATYNRAHFIEETLISIQNQTFKDWECLIIDDGGNDNTREVLEPFLKKDIRFNYLQRPDSYKKQIPGCRNYGLDISLGDFIIFFDDDDIVHPQNLELCVNEIQMNNYQFCRYTREVFKGEFNGSFNLSTNFSTFEISNIDLYKLVNNSLQFNSCQVMWRKECFDNVRFNQRLLYAEEWECYARILMKPIKGININKALFFGRKHDESNTGEFWKRDNIRFNSYKTAIQLMVENLNTYNQLSIYLFEYLIGLAISCGDKSLVNNILKINNSTLRTKLFYNLKYYVFPITKQIKYKLKTSK